MVSMGEMAGSMLPSGSTLMPIMIAIGIGLLIAIAVTGGVWFYLDYKKYNKIIILHKVINGRLCKAGTFKATFQKIGIAGDTWCRVKNGKIITRPKLEYDRNVFLFFERQDGEWINFEIRDIDEIMKKAGVFYLDEDMRLHRIGIQKNLEKRLEKEGFWQKWGGLILNVMIILIITVCLIVLFNKLTEVATSMSQMANAVTETARSLTNVQTTQQSGVVPVGLNGVPI